MRRTSSTGPTYDEYVAARWAALYRTAYVLTGDAAEADVLARRTLVKAYLSWRKVRSDPGSDAYARSILTDSYVRRRDPRLDRSARRSRARELEQTHDDGERATARAIVVPPPPAGAVLVEEGERRRRRDSLTEIEAEIEANGSGKGRDDQVPYTCDITTRTCVLLQGSAG